MLSLDMPASPEMESIFLIGGTALSRPRWTPTENLVNPGGDAVTAVGFDRGAATAEGAEKNDGRKTGE